MNNIFFNEVKIWAIRCWKSRTIMFNLFIAFFASLEGIYQVLQPYLPGNVFAWITVILTVGNAILRVLTTQPLSNK